MGVQKNSSFQFSTMTCGNLATLQVTGAWASQAAEWRQKLGVPESKSKPWVPHMRGGGLSITKRVEKILNLVALHHLGLQNADIPFESKKHFLRDIFCDISQNPKFKAFSSDLGIAPCLATSTMMYSYGEDRMVLPVELLYFQGHSRGIKIPDNMRSSEIRNLAGEGMTLPCLGTVIWALYLTKGLP